MPAQTATKSQKRRSPRHSKGADPPAGPEHFTIDRDTLEHLPTSIHRAVAEARIKDGSWNLIESKGKKVTT